MRRSFTIRVDSDKDGSAWVVAASKTVPISGRAPNARQALRQAMVAAQDYLEWDAPEKVTTEERRATC